MHVHTLLLCPACLQENHLDLLVNNHPILWYYQSKRKERKESTLWSLKVCSYVALIP